jgi:hypothetical protein
MVEENISFFIDDSIQQNDDDFIVDLNQLLNTEYVFKENDILFTKIVHYDINYTVKQLLVICEYYGIAKDLRITKCNKSDILNTLIIYENNIENLERVNKRKQLWHYIDELKNDKFMKKYVLWN